MGFGRLISKGDPIDFSASRQNEITRALGRMGNMGDGEVLGRILGRCEIPVYNYGKTVLPAGAVTIDFEKPVVGGALPVKPFSGNPMVVLENALQSGRGVSAVAVGLVKVTLSGNSGNYVNPVTGGGFSRVDYGLYPLLHPSGYIFVDTNRTGGGMFALTMNKNMLRVGSGYVNENGINFVNYAGEEIKPSVGTLCIYSSPDKVTGEWTYPAAVFSTPDQYHYPIGYLSKTDGGWSIIGYPVSVATIIGSKKCTLSEA